MLNQNQMIDKLNESFIDVINDVLVAAKNFIEKENFDLELVTELNWLCSDLSTIEIEDDDLIIFKYILSEIDDMQEEIKTGKSCSGRSINRSDTEKDLQKFIVKMQPEGKESCRALIARYSPILKKLKEKYRK